MAEPLRKVGGGKGRAMKENYFFSDGEVPTAIKLKGVRALMALPLTKYLL